MLTSFDRILATGTPELVLVSGYSGIGKSSVVSEVHKVLVPPRGLFAAGTPSEKQEETIFEIVNQFNRGAALVVSREEGERVAELNLGSSPYYARPRAAG